MSGVFHIDNAARRKLCAPPDWKAYRFEAITGGFIVTGSEPVGTYLTGPRKGSPKWVGKGVQVILSDVEVKAEEALYVQTTGNCHECLGKKKILDSWSKAEGVKRKPCPHCNATGKATAVLA